MNSDEIEAAVLSYFREFSEDILCSFRYVCNSNNENIATIIPEQMCDSSGLFFTGDFDSNIPAHNLPNVVPDDILENTFIETEMGERGAIEFLGNIYMNKTLLLLSNAEPKIGKFRIYIGDSGEFIDT